jgi:hypothetical protein
VSKKRWVPSGRNWREGCDHGDLAVEDGVFCAVFGADFHHTETDFPHDAFFLVDDDMVTNAELFFEEKGKAGDHVLDESLGTKANGAGQNGTADGERFGGHFPDEENFEKRDDGDGIADNAVENAFNGFGFFDPDVIIRIALGEDDGNGNDEEGGDAIFRGLGVGLPVEPAAGEEIGDAVEHEAKKKTPF